MNVLRSKESLDQLTLGFTKSFFWAMKYMPEALREIMLERSNDLDIPEKLIKPYIENAFKAPWPREEDLRREFERQRSPME